MSDVELLTYVKAVSNSIDELNKERKYFDNKFRFTMLEVIKLLLVQRLIKPVELSMVAINLLT